MFSTTRPVDEPRVLFLVFVYTTVIQRDEGRGGGTRKVKRKGHRTRVIVVHDNTTVPRYVEEKKKKEKKTRRTGGVEFYLRPCTSRASDSCLQNRLRGRGLGRRRRTKNASEEKERGLLREMV